MKIVLVRSPGTTINHPEKTEANSPPSKRQKMAGKEIPARLTTQEFLKRLKGPSVDIYVGPKSQHFNVPKDVLCYYSTYFDRCFNGGFKDAKEQKLILAEDEPEFFQLLMDWVFSGRGESLEIKGVYENKINTSLQFMKCAEKYDLVGAIDSINGQYKRLVKDQFHDYKYVEGEFETVFRILPKGHEIRASVAKNALPAGFINGRFSKQEEMVDGFAAETLKQFRRFRRVQDKIWIRNPSTGEKTQVDDDM